MNPAIEWALEVCREAENAANNGDRSLVNQMAKSPAMAYVFNNVHMLKSVTRESFAMYYPGMVKELERMHAQYQSEAKIAEAADRIVSVEERITSMEDALRSLQEAVSKLTAPQTPLESNEDDSETDESEAKANDIANAMKQDAKPVKKRTTK